MTEFGMVIQVGEKHISRGQPHPHPKRAGPQHPPKFLGPLPMPKQKFPYAHNYGDLPENFDPSCATFQGDSR